MVLFNGRCRYLCGDFSIVLLTDNADMRKSIEDSEKN